MALARKLAGSTMLLCAMGAVAHAATIELEWRAPADAGCPTRQQVLAAIDAAVTRDAALADPVKVSAEVSQASSGRFALSLVTIHHDRTGRRALEAQTCRELGDATASIVAWMISPEAAAVTTPVPPTPEPVPPRERRWWLGAGGAMDVGTLPAAAFGAELRGGVDGQWFAARIGVAHFPHSEGKLADGRGGTFSLTVATAAVCARRSWAALCLGGEADGARGKGTGDLDALQGDAVWPAVISGVELAWRHTSRWSLLGRVEGVLPLLRERFVIEGAGQVHRVGPALRASVGFGFRP